MVLLDATPEAIVGDAGVRAGFVASSVMASVFKALAPLGLTRSLLAMRRMPPYPEQATFRCAVSTPEYRRWVADVCRDFAGAAAQELRSVLPTAAAAQRLAATDGPQPYGDLPLAVLTSHAFGDRWIAMHRDVAALSRASTHRITDDRSHNIHISHPALVADAVRDIAATIAHGGPPWVSSRRPEW